MEHALCAAQFEGTIDYYLKDKRGATYTLFVTVSDQLSWEWDHIITKYKCRNLTCTP